MTTPAEVWCSQCDQPSVVTTEDGTAYCWTHIPTPKGTRP